MFLKRAVALGLSCAVAVSLVPMFTGNSEVKADEWVKSKENTKYGLQLVKNPERPSSSSTPWQGNYVYFGKNNGNPIKFRVLDCDSTAYGGNTLFLDSDMLFDKQKYDEDSSVWADSDLRKYFNGEIFKATEMQLDVIDIINCLFSEVNPIPVKYAASRMGICKNILRMPLTPMSDDKAQKLEGLMKELNLI